MVRFNSSCSGTNTSVKSWHSTAAIGFQVGNSTHRGFPITAVVFLLLVLVNAVLLLLSLLERSLVSAFIDQRTKQSQWVPLANSH